MHRLCTQQKVMVRKLGPRMVDELGVRLAQLEAAETLEDMRSLPGARCHELTGDRKGQIAVDLVHPKRLVFIPDHVPLPAKPDGGLDWNGVTSICIEEIVDYH